MKLLNLAPWAQRIEVDGEVLPFTEARLIIDINNNGVFMKIEGKTRENRVMNKIPRKLIDESVRHDVEMILSVPCKPNKRPFKSKDTRQEIAKYSMVQAELTTFIDGFDIDFEFVSKAITCIG